MQAFLLFGSTTTERLYNYTVSYKILQFYTILCILCILWGIFFCIHNALLALGALETLEAVWSIGAIPWKPKEN